MKIGDKIRIVTSIANAMVRNSYMGREGAITSVEYSTFAASRGKKEESSFDNFRVDFGGIREHVWRCHLEERAILVEEGPLYIYAQFTERAAICPYCGTFCYDCACDRMAIVIRCHECHEEFIIDRVCPQYDNGATTENANLVNKARINEERIIDRLYKAARDSLSLYHRNNKTGLNLNCVASLRYACRDISYEGWTNSATFLVHLYLRQGRRCQEDLYRFRRKDGTIMAARIEKYFRSQKDMVIDDWAVTDADDAIDTARHELPGNDFYPRVDWIQVAEEFELAFREMDDEATIKNVA